MNIINTILTQTADKITANAHYIVEYIVRNDVLTRIHASVISLANEGNEGENLGYITLENGNVFCNVNERATLSPLCADFEEIVAAIRASVPGLSQCQEVPEK